MLAEWGVFALICASWMALLLIGLAWWGAQHEQAALIQLAVAAAWSVFLLTGLAFAILIVAFLQDDFSLKYVASHSSIPMPTMFKVSAAWGAHEGSLLLWAWMLTGWVAAVAAKPGKLSAQVHARTLAVLGFVSLGFLLFILFTSSPFERMAQIPEDGLGLNPLLQDIALIMHPPLLYMGYVGLAVSFALALALLWQAHAPREAFAWARSWTLVSWAFLTLGIALGSWWAYYELGWGGWWFWDPVENASLLPWLVATALIHSLLVSEKRGVLVGWTLLLAILAFAMSLVGAFLVRSGVLTSVHAFATDPTRGTFILLYLIVVIGAALALFSYQAPKLAKTKPLAFVSKESALLFNNVLLMVMTASVLLGTLYPLLLDALNLGKLSVGPPYFNAIILPLTVPLALLMGVGVFIRWREDRVRRLSRVLLWAGLLSGLCVLMGALWVLPDVEGWLVAGVGLSAWVALTASYALWHHARNSGRLSLPSFGAMLAHIGFAMLMLGVTLSSLYGVEKDVRLAPGEHYALNQYQLSFVSVAQDAGANYLTTQARLRLYRGGELVNELHPEKRLYIGHKMPMSEVAIEAGLFHDVYVALGEPLDDQGAWSFRIQYKPFIRGIWLGALLMAIGGLIAVWGRYRRVSA
ncbi:MAG: heme lyase CcmF/NrfE family subunit [Thiomicrospira sp.]|jgi:cytochrome c-type biogenesis protein CcmF|nr:heme lyase CcmF/NrfE family subunit [Thiomicrospira sp.]